MSTSAQPKIPFNTALLITMNTMFGSGLFINTVYLAHTAFFWGFLAYIMVAIILLPLMIAMAQVTSRHPYGGFYQYAAHALGASWGFLSAWFYFVGKLASAALLIHVFVTIMGSTFPSLNSISPLTADFCILLLMVCINYFGVRLGGLLISTLFLFKIMPVLFVILVALAYCTEWQLPAVACSSVDIFSTIPNVLYAFLGFEVACSISMHIEDAQKNTARIIMYAFSSVVILTVMYQLLVFLLIGPELGNAHSYTHIFPAIFNTLWAHAPLPAFAQIVLKVFHVAIACAALGGSYGMIFGNAWNLYVLAHNRHVPYSDFFTHKNRFGAPFFCFLAEGIICSIYLYATGGSSVILQQISVFGCVVAFALSISAALVEKQRLAIERRSYVSLYIEIAALVSCTILLVGSLRNFFGCIHKWPFYIFLMMVLAGTISYFIVSYKKNKLSVS